MELQFQKTDIACLQMLKCQVQNQEQTQEVRLDDTMPPVEKVLCAWGQVLMRGKQWRNTGVQVSGGVMAWVLYGAEDGSCHSVQTWVPFQVKMDIPQQERDGMILSDVRLRAVDARCINERKLLVRIDIGVQICTAVPQNVEVYSADQLPEDVQVLEKTYPVDLPMEMGEKEFVIDEILMLPGSCVPMEQPLSYSMQPELIDRKVMADKVVFRGTGLLHILYRGQDGQLYSWDFELPFSQFDQLTGQYEQSAAARIVPALTSLELEQDPEGKLQVKAGLVGQYMIYDRKELTLAQDAYSTSRQLTPQIQQLQIPAVLDMQIHTIQCEQTAAMEGSRAVDVTFLPDQPAQLRASDGVELDLSGRFQILSCDHEGKVHVETPGWNGQLPVRMDDDCRLEAFVAVTGMPVGVPGAGNVTVRADMLVDTACMSESAMPMITGVLLEPREEEAGERPSVILRRAGSDGLWQIAKQTGSTVDMIRRANHLTDDPEEGQMLLIPLG